MSKVRKSIIILLSVIFVAATSWYLYITYTLVVFEPLELNDKRELVPAETDYDFYKNLPVVLDDEHVKYELDILDHPWVSLKVARNKELILNLTEKAQDVVWLYNHKRNEKHPSFPCKGEGYSGFVFEKEYSDHWWGKGTVNIDLTCEDIALAEQILKTNIKAAGGIDKWHIDFELSKYYRQYFGYRKASGDVCVHIEFTRKPANMSQFQDDIQGKSYYPIYSVCGFF